MNRDQEKPLDQDLVEEEKHKELNEVLEDIAYTEAEDYLRELWRKENEKTTSNI